MPGFNSIKLYLICLIALLLNFEHLFVQLYKEIAGITHDSEEMEMKDAERDKVLNSIGYTVLRFSSWEILNKMVDASIIIAKWIDENATIPPPAPSKGGK